MTDDLDTLRPEVREAVEHCDRNFALAPYNGHRANWPLLRAELLRMHESAVGGYEDGWHALRNERDALKAELAALKVRTQWRQISTAPKDGTFILVLDADGEVRYAQWNKPGWWCGHDCYGNDEFVEDPTHWMPLPPPQGEE